MPNRYEKRVLRVLKYIHDNPADDLSLDVLADVAAMSRFHWHRVFHALTGETCAQAVRRVRLYRAASWLVQSDVTPAEIAKRVGYPNIQSFSRAFTESFGISPGSFRKMGSLTLPKKSNQKGKFKMIDVEIKDIPARRLAALMHIGAYDTVGESFEKLEVIASESDLGSQVQGVVGVHYDDPNVVSAEKLRCHAGLIVPEGVTLPEGLDDVILAGGSYAIAHYKGPYTSIKIAYDYLFGEWLPGSNRDPEDAPCYELYLNDPAAVPPEELLTDILLPLKP